MAARPRILIVGGSGVFGRRLAQELVATTSSELILAGRDLQQVEATCRALDTAGRVAPREVNLSDPASLGRAAAGCFAVVCAAGPFQSLQPILPAAAVRAGAHWLDIADASSWVLPLLADRALGAAAEAADLAVLTGLSSVPTLSGVLVRWCHARLPSASGGQVTLFIGNRNAKGRGAIASALGARFGDPRPVDLPVGRRMAYRFDAPDSVLLREELGLTVEFRVSFEWSAVNKLMAAVAPLGQRLAPGSRSRLARWLAALAVPLSRFGSDVGCLQAELWTSRGGSVAAALIGTGQRMAILPCALAIEALLRGEPRLRGLVRPATWLPPEAWLARLRSRGLVVHERSAAVADQARG